MVDVTQADRDAAARWLAGTYSISEAFARHRIEAEKRGALAMREAAAQRFDVKEARMLSAIKQNPGHRLCEAAEAVAGFAKRTADTIRSLNPDTIGESHE